MNPPAPCGPTPSSRQLAWHAMEMYGFIHFTVNTFTDREWGYGDEAPSVFNPRHFDARQWACVARDAGLQGLILTAKHHDGFCLWPSAYTEHSVKHSPWRHGKGDVVQEFYEACREFGLKPGFYLSPWDRNHGAYGTAAYEAYYRDQLRELLGRYPGELFEVWFDGANGGDGYYGGARETRTIDRTTYYNFPRLFEIVRELQPMACIFSDAGPDVRWCGNEIGRTSATCWNRIHPEGIAIGGVDDLTRLARGEEDGARYCPPEVDVSIRPGWFYHPHEQPHALDELLEMYFASVGYGACLNLNLPPDRDGLIPQEDVVRLREFRAALDALFAHDLAGDATVTVSNTRGDAPAFAASHLLDPDPATYWATDDGVTQAEVVIDFGRPVRPSCIRLEEALELGQRVAAFAIDAAHGSQWLELVQGSTIGARRLLRLPRVTTTRLRVRVTRALACPALRRVSVY